ncbi:MAG: hypothetical protein ACERJ2_16040, partial [Filomicrobium sp.]
MKKRLSFSPDLADAGALTFAVNLSRVQEVDWDEPVVPAGGWLGGLTIATEVHVWILRAATRPLSGVKRTLPLRATRCTS